MFCFIKNRPINSIVAIGTIETYVVYTIAVIETPQLWLFKDKCIEHRVIKTFNDRKGCRNFALANFPYLFWPTILLNHRVWFYFILHMLSRDLRRRHKISETHKPVLHFFALW